MQLFIDKKKDMEAIKLLVESQNLYSPLHINKVGSQYSLHHSQISDDQMIEMLLANNLAHIVGGA